MEFHKVRVSKIEDPTVDARTIYLDVPEEKVNYRAGQFITIECEIDGERIRRSYSLSSAPIQNDIHFTVKRVEGGAMSTYLCEEVEVGDALKVNLPPEGRFVVQPKEEVRRDHYFFAAGSGITPIISMIKTLLEKEAMSCCYLLYGNKNPEQAIYRDDLQSMAELYEGQFFFKEIYSRDKKSGASFFSRLWPGSDDGPWHGRIDKKSIRKFLRKFPARADESHFYTCGPGSMNETVAHTLRKRGVPDSAIHREVFINADQKESPEPRGDKTTLEFTLYGETFTEEMDRSETILEHLIRAGYDPPHSCTSGSCATCMAKKLEGRVKMDIALALEDEEIEEGYILTCQSHPTSARVVIDYDA